MNLKHALTGLGIAGMLATGSFADAPKQKVYDIKTDTERILYKKGIRGSSPDVMYVYIEKEPDLGLGDTKPRNIYPFIKVFNDYDGDGIIGNHEKDRCVEMISTIAKDKDFFKFIPKDDPESDFRDPSKFIYSLSTPTQSQFSYSIIEGALDLERRKFGGRLVCGKYGLLEDDSAIIVDRTSSVREYTRETILERIDEMLGIATIQYQYCKKQVLNKY